MRERRHEEVDPGPPRHGGTPGLRILHGEAEIAEAAERAADREYRISNRLQDRAWRYAEMARRHTSRGT